MSEPPIERFEFWTRFVCAFVFFGMVLAFVSIRFFLDEDRDLFAVITVLVILDVLISGYAARHGDSAWEKILGVLGALCWWT